MLLFDKQRYGEVYNIAPERVYVIKEIIEIIEGLLNTHYHLEVDRTLLRPTDERIIAGDISKLKSDTGLEQTRTLRGTVENMLGYWEEYLG